MKKSIFLLCIVSLAIYIISTNKVLAASNISMDLINKERVNQGLKHIEVDENLCILAKMLADDREAAYPEKINDSLFANPKYKPYIKDYSNYALAVLTLNDVLIKAYKEKGMVIPLFTEEQIAQQSIAGGQAVNSEITNGCSAMSSGKVGYKPYAYFIGGIKKEVLNIPISQAPTTVNNQIPTIINNYVEDQSIFDKIRLFFINLFSKFRP